VLRKFQQQYKRIVHAFYNHSKFEIQQIIVQSALQKRKSASMPIQINLYTKTSTKGEDTFSEETKQGTTSQPPDQLGLSFHTGNT
jgi:hypothetical protein